MKAGEEQSTSDMIKVVFNEFIAADYCNEGIYTFMNFVAAQSIAERITKSNNFILLVKKQSTIVGVIEIRENKHVSLLFIDKNYHRRGLAKELFRKAVERCKEENAKLTQITVNSSPYAKHVYEKLGFVQIQEEQIKDGIRYIPMKLNVKEEE
jgi:predicted GNAT family N-acyltransferase